MNELEQRAIDCPHWEWIPGMLTHEGERIIYAGRLDGLACYEIDARTVGGGIRTLSEQLPDFDDPATLGCLLHLVREAHGDSMLSVIATGDPRGPWVLDNYTRDTPKCASYAEALVAGLEAAPYQRE